MRDQLVFLRPCKVMILVVRCYCVALAAGLCEVCGGPWPPGGGREGLVSWLCRLAHFTRKTGRIFDSFRIAR